MAKMKAEMETMQRIMEEQKREIQKLKSSGNDLSSGHHHHQRTPLNTNMPIPSHAVAFKQGIQQYGFKLNRRKHFLNIFDTPNYLIHHFVEFFT